MNEGSCPAQTVRRDFELLRSRRSWLVSRTYDANLRLFGEAGLNGSATLPLSYAYAYNTASPREMHGLSHGASQRTRMPLADGSHW